MGRTCRPTFWHAGMPEEPIHHWVAGNFGHQPCRFCGKDCGSISSISGLRCAWCKTYAHDRCAKTASPMCDLGDFAKITLPNTAFRIVSGVSVAVTARSRPPLKRVLLRPSCRPGR